MELSAAFLLVFDRAAYIYRGDSSQTGFIMVRLSNFMLFFLTPALVLTFNLYLTDIMLNEAKLKMIPKRLNVVSLCSVFSMALVVLSHFTGLYYYFDENNIYCRGRQT